MTSSPDDYALDWGTMGRKKAKALRLVAKVDGLYAIYETDILYLNIYPRPYVMEVPVNVSAVSFTMGILIDQEEARKIEVGEWEYFEQLARDVQFRHSRYRNTPVDHPPFDDE